MGTYFPEKGRGIVSRMDYLFDKMGNSLDVGRIKTDVSTPDCHRNTLSNNIHIFFAKYATETIDNAVASIRWG